MSAEESPLPQETIPAALRRRAVEAPKQPAVIGPVTGRERGRPRQISYGELDRASSEVAYGLAQLGCARGGRVILFVPPSPTLFSLAFGLLRGGFVPVLIDPGIGGERIGDCIRESGATTFIGNLKATLGCRLLRWGQGQLHRFFTIGLGGFRTIRRAGQGAPEGYQLDLEGSEEAAILFTSGSTGQPKGAIYEHRQFSARY